MQAGQHVSQVLTDRNIELAAALDHTEDCGNLGASFLGTDVQPVAATDRDSTDILPISVQNSKFTIAGIRSTGVRFAIEITNNAVVDVLSMWTTVLAQLRWFPNGCWIRWHARV